MSHRQPLLVAVAVLWLAVDLLLLRIASGGNLQDWGYVFHTQPLVFVATIMVTAGSAVAAGLVLRRPVRRRVLLAAAAWGVLVAVFGVALRVAHHDSASLVVVGSLVCGWLAYRAAGGARHGLPDPTRLP